MTTLPTGRLPALAALAAGLGAQFADDAAYVLLPPTALLAPFSAVLAIVLTAGASRLVTRRLAGRAMARTGLAVRAVSAGAGLLVSGLGLLALVIATLTVLAGVAGAVAGDRVPAGD